MSFFVQRTYNSLCPGELKDEININNATITTELLQIVYDGVSESFFEFVSEPPAPEITELDSVLATFVCPVDDTNPVDTQDFDDTAAPAEDVIWSSEQITNTFVPLETTITGTKSVTGGGDLTANRTIELVNDQDTPGNDKLYGTNGSGVKGWYDQPSGGGDNVVKPTGLDYWHEVLTFSKGGSIGNAFVNIENSLESNDSSYVMTTSGQIIHVTVSVGEKYNEDSKITLVKGAEKNGSGQFSGGTAMGADLVKNLNAEYQTWLGLSGYTFVANDRISVYIKDDPKGMTSPVVRVYVRYD